MSLIRGPSPTSRERMTNEPQRTRKHSAPAVDPAVASPEQRQDSLVASELRYRRLFETARDGIFLLDAETGRITDANPFLVEMLGYTLEELIGKQLWEIGPVKDILASQDAVRHLQDKEYIRYENLPLETRSKQRVQVEFVSNVYLVGQTRVIQCNVRDITARKDAEEIARQATNDLLATLEELTQRDAGMNRLNQMSDLLHACATQAEAFQVIGLMAGDLFVGQSGFLAMVQTPNRQLETVARWGEHVDVRSFRLDDCWAMRRGQPHEVTDPVGGLACGHFVDQPTTGYVCVPLTIQGETLGLLCATRKTSSGSRSPDATRQIVVTLGETVKLSLSNLRLRERLRDQATMDVLTGLYNRRFMDESLARELHRALRLNSPLCVAMLDLDHFKRFNDTNGHEVGDTLLSKVGRLLSENVRKSDITCRYGGEEFVLVFPDSTLAATRQRVDQLRLLIGAIDLRNVAGSVGHITISAGIAQAAAEGSTPGELLGAADEALYLAKQSGRDCVIEHPANELASP
jgi:diguanylate cyclase (GGDEF)-like protein/PAS domain S-box-containing protein